MTEMHSPKFNTRMRTVLYVYYAEYIIL